MKFQLSCDIFQNNWRAKELEAAIKAIIEQTGANSIKDMGKVMGAANQQLAGKADGKSISEVVKKLLAP